MNDRTRPMILVVNNTPENIDVLSGLLGDEYDVNVANNGEVALKIAGKTTESTRQNRPIGSKDAQHD